MLPLLPQPHQQSRLNESSRNALCNSTEVTINPIREKKGMEGGREEGREREREGGKKERQMSSA